MKLNSTDWLAIQFALEGEIRRMKEYKNDPHPEIVDSSKNHIKRYRDALAKVKEMVE